MNPLPPIPTPMALRWREFRIRALPPLVFVAGGFAAVWIWQHDVAAPTLVGEVEARRAVVASVRAGTVSKLNVDRFSPVRAGDPVAEVLVCTPQYFESLIGVVKAEAEVLRLQLDPVVTQERSKVDFERLRLEVLDGKVALAADQMQLRYAEAEYNRLAALYQDQSGVVSKDLFEQALRNRDTLRTQVESRGKMLEDLTASLNALRLSRPLPPAKSGVPEGWQAALDLQEERLKQTLAEFSPVTLTAPIDGMVSTVYRHSGETVAANEPIVTITSTNSERIVGYLLPPWPFEPKVGAPVEVRSRSGARSIGRAWITKVAGHLDLVTTSLTLAGSTRPNTLTARGPGAELGAGNQPLQAGLPLEFTMPEGLRLLPGETVDLRLLAAGPVAKTN